MNRFPVNLAAQPIEKVRAARRAVACGATATLLLTLVHLAFLGWAAGGRGVPEATSQASIDEATLGAWQAEVDRLIGVADVQRARAAGGAVESGNQLIAWRTIPWRSIFADLERVLPERARLEVVAPGIDDDGAVRMQMTAAARDTGPLQDLLLELELHPAFDEAWPIHEETLPDGSSRMTLRALYVSRAERAADPGGGSAAPAPTASGSAEGER
ncbi:MAG TPA: hypothetical protein QGG47_03800 [Acidobacteriota bacterium]|nr:hypothetical protein [Acidobacteriota bacterium]